MTLICWICVFVLVKIYEGYFSATKNSEELWRSNEYYFVYLFL